MNNSQKEQIFNQMLEYYDFAQKLLIIAETKNPSPEYLEMISSLVDILEASADELTSEFIDYAQNGADFETADELTEVLDIILLTAEKLEEKIKNDQESE